MIDGSTARSLVVAPSRIGQFAGVGVVGAIVDNAALGLLVETGVLEPIAAKVVAVELAIVVMFAINDRWTFREYGLRTARHLLVRFTKSHAVRFAGTAIAFGVLFFLHSRLGVWYLAANVVGIGIGFVVNYLFESAFTWRVQETDGP